MTVVRDVAFLILGAAGIITEIRGGHPSAELLLAYMAVAGGPGVLAATVLGRTGSPSSPPAPESSSPPSSPTSPQ